jgi:hypothetical protein
MQNVLTGIINLLCLKVGDFRFLTLYNLSYVLTELCINLYITSFVLPEIFIKCLMYVLTELCIN